MGKRILRDQDELFHAEVADRYKSTAGTQEKVDEAIVARDLAEVEKTGYVVIERLIPQAKLDEICADILPRFTHTSGRNTFEGFATQRLYSLLEKTMVCNELVDHPRVLALLDRILEPNYLLSAVQPINILPGEAAQPLHHDDGFYRVKRPRAPLGAATVFALDDFTAHNGATVVLPGSDTWDERRPTETDERRTLVMPAGSVVFFVGTLWHGGGANRTDRSRLALAVQYCAPWCRPQENFSLAISRERVKQCSAHVQRMLGYSIHQPFMGYVDGMHPLRLLAR
jgi:ectoine hydroxylase-related dioxygenase (phytanoyl-CoA dioxygenase family)